MEFLELIQYLTEGSDAQLAEIPRHMEQLQDSVTNSISMATETDSADVFDLNQEGILYVFSFLHCVGIYTHSQGSITSADLFLQRIRRSLCTYLNVIFIWCPFFAGQ